MFLSAYHFDGRPAELLPAYRDLQAIIPPERTEVHMCIAHDRGITVYDACPSRAVFEEFHRSPEFRAAVEGAGLPVPRVDPLGDVHAAYIREAAPR